MRQDTCYYDGKCSLCTRSRRVLTALDWLGTLRFVDMTAEGVDLPVPPSPPPETALEGMPMRTADGRVLIGYRAMRRALLRTPLGALVAWVMYVPGVSWLGERVYRWVARHRPRACEVRP